jgi:hypothetical protein
MYKGHKREVCCKCFPYIMEFELMFENPKQLPGTPFTHFSSRVVQRETFYTGTSSHPQTQPVPRFRLLSLSPVSLLRPSHVRPSPRHMIQIYGHSPFTL